jgi:hypothetical protein
MAKIPKKKPRKVRCKKAKECIQMLCEHRRQHLLNSNCGNDCGEFETVGACVPVKAKASLSTCEQQGR